MSNHDLETLHRASVSRPPTSDVRVQRVHFSEVDVELSPETDLLVREEPLEIRVHGEPVAVTMRTPGHDGELACGFVATEKIVANPRHIRHASHCRTVAPELGRNIIHVMVPDHIPLQVATRTIAAGSGCGLCGKATLDSVFLRAPQRPKLSRPLPLGSVHHWLEEMRTRQHIFQQTGGLHAAALVNLRTGKVLVAREDIGRHNAVDKVIGHQVLRRALPLSDTLLLVSSRVGFEIAQKAYIAGIPAIAAVSAPSSLALGLAEDAGMVLLGFVRDGRLNVYSGQDHCVLQEFGDEMK